mmetsp:Transcript_18612/g.53810  ORF Transcript_18612/g.53810 Transcript_18612/m.53810 type:complete len:217 (-) Transcript_18612:1430-2080(-)
MLRLFDLCLRCPTKLHHGEYNIHDCAQDVRDIEHVQGVLEHQEASIFAPEALTIIRGHPLALLWVAPPETTGPARPAGRVGEMDAGQKQDRVVHEIALLDPTDLHPVREHDGVRADVQFLQVVLREIVIQRPQFIDRPASVLCHRRNECQADKGEQEDEQLHERQPHCQRLVEPRLGALVLKLHDPLCNLAPDCGEHKCDDSLHCAGGLRGDVEGQ